MKTRERQENAIETRSLTQGDLIEVGRSTKAKKRVLHVMLQRCGTKQPKKIRTSKTLTTAKKAILEHCKSLPI